ncbi:uncharacterized protein BHQ10_003675 [Talaromyces amestolkiae]|uniref:Uncharacterized protein n=1 Tax=Talaromyces amestolkiae TaxID=1196081 RepID=A0A364KVU7_TALAM|nr:uncharacterized protein BHQ10_003675 [Talaromyces amestolkiae]RAO67663.1 hypothetical protein BHQ10_003675 [Talaromyces amestolkiae]
MAGFPALKPAFTVRISADAPLSVGSHHRKTPLLVVPIAGGTVVSEPGFTPSLNAKFEGTGNDYVRSDPDGKRTRLNAHSVIKTNDEALIYLHFQGTVNLTESTMKAMSGHAGDVETPFGDSFTSFNFETGDERYKDLENGVFVGQGHFIIKVGEKTMVEYKVSQVIVG